MEIHVTYAYTIISSGETPNCHLLFTNFKPYYITAMHCEKKLNNTKVVQKLVPTNNKSMLFFPTLS